MNSAAASSPASTPITAAMLRALARFFCGDQLDVEVQLVLARDDVPPCVLGADDDAAAPLGWCTWLRTAPLTRDPDETILTLSDGVAHP